MTVLLRFEKFALIVSNVKVVIFWQFILGSPVYIAEWGALKRSTKSPATKNQTTTEIFLEALGLGIISIFGFRSKAIKSLFLP